MTINKNEFKNANGLYELSEELIDTILDVVNGNVVKLSNLIEDSGWVNVPLINGYSPRDDSAGYCQCRKVNGTVEIRFQIKGISGALPSNIVTGYLPVGFRPNRQVHGMVFLNSDFTKTSGCWVNVDGSINVPISTAWYPTTSNSWVTLVIPKYSV